MANPDAKVLLVINAAVVDQELLDLYRAAAKPSMARYGARMLAGANDAEIIEGQPLGTRVVVVEFPSRDAFHAWYADPEYAGPLAMRLKATNGIALLVDGRE
ncbi:MAG: hypothetical protein QOE09_905 [Ilumatobacteraceae bacterium]|jgi:uncharacterized protein (DUF1330 family)